MKTKEPRRRSLKSQLEELDTSMLGPREKYKLDEVSDEAFDLFVTAIVEMAWKDLMMSKLFLERHEIKGKPTFKQSEAMWRIRDAKWFFESEWFMELSNGRISSNWVSDCSDKIMGLEKRQRLTAINLVKKRITSAIIY